MAAKNILVRWALLALLVPAAAMAATTGREAQNEAVARRYFETLNGRSFERLDPLVSTWVVHHDAPSGETLSAKQLVTDLEELQKAFPDYTLDVKEMVASGNKVTVRYRFSGTHRAPIMGVEPTGKKVSAWAVEVLRIEEGKVREIWGTPLTESLRSALVPATAPSPQPQ